MLAEKKSKPQTRSIVRIPVATIDEITDPRKYIPSSVVLKNDKDELVHVTSELHQVAYLRFKDIHPDGTKLRTWTKKTSGGHSKKRSKVYYYFVPTDKLKGVLEEYKSDHNGCLSIMRAYDVIRASSFRQLDS